jgi:hypothetical protein
LDPTARLRLATRLHFMLRRQLDQDFDVAILLHGGFEARAALRLCRASGRPELIAAARELESANRAEAKASARRAAAAADERAARPTTGRKAQDMAWAKDTSGFGMSQPPDGDASDEYRVQRKPGWLARLGLARRSAAG